MGRGVKFGMKFDSPPPWRTSATKRGGRSLHILPSRVPRRLSDERARRGAKRRASREVVSPSIQLQRGFPDKDRTTAGRAPPSERKTILSRFCETLT